MTLKTNQEYHQASKGLVAGGTLAYVGAIFLLISFISPFWVQSFDGTSSAFKHMGLWQYCFDQFRYPYHQFDKIFDGCHYIYSDEYYVIREWLLPGWLLVIQAWMTLSFMLSFGSLIIIALIVVRYPLRFILHYEWMLTAISFLCIAISYEYCRKLEWSPLEILTRDIGRFLNISILMLILIPSFLMFISVWLFWTQSSRRDWLMYPNFNHLSYSYYFGMFSFVIHTYAAYILYYDARSAYERRRESRNLVMQMDDANSRNGFV